jgi:hypothetical protein
VFKKDRPQLAVMAALAATRHGEAGHKLLKKSMPALKAIDKPNMVMAISVARVIAGPRMGGAGGPQLPKKLRQQLVDQLLAWPSTWIRRMSRR